MIHIYYINAIIYIMGKVEPSMSLKYWSRTATFQKKMIKREQ